MIILVQQPGLCGVSFVTEPFSFSLHIKKSKHLESQDYNYSAGLHVIYGESGVGKSELINLLANKEQYKSALFNIDRINSQKDVKVILQNPDLQIISNTK